MGALSYTASTDKIVTRHSPSSPSPCRHIRPWWMAPAGLGCQETLALTKASLIALRRPPERRAFTFFVGVDVFPLFVSLIIVDEETVDWYLPFSFQPGSKAA